MLPSWPGKQRALTLSACRSRFVSHEIIKCNYFSFEHQFHPRRATGDLTVVGCLRAAGSAVVIAITRSASNILAAHERSTAMRRCTITNSGFSVLFVFILLIHCFALLLLVADMRTLPTPLVVLDGFEWLGMFWHANPVQSVNAEKTRGCCFLFLVVTENHGEKIIKNMS